MPLGTVVEALTFNAYIVCGLRESTIYMYMVAVI